MEAYMLIFRESITIDTLDAWQMANDDLLYTGVNVSDKNIELEVAENLFNILSNPNNGQFQIEFLENIQDTFNYQVLDVSGRVVFSKNNEPVQQIVPVKLDIAAGVYFLKIEHQGRIETKKFVVN